MLKGAMTNSAMDALNRAANRTKRLADRAACNAAAKPGVYPDGESKLKGPQATTTGGSPGASSSRSTATTVHYPDAEALANARRGYAAHLASEKAENMQTSAERTRPVARPHLVRVNSVPVLAAPCTPADRIRRSGTGVLHALSQVDGGAEMLNGEEPAAEPTQPSEKRPLEKSTGSRKKKRAKKTKGNKNGEGHCGGEDQEWENLEAESWVWDGKEAYWYGDGSLANWYGEGEVSEEGSAPAPPDSSAPPQGSAPAPVTAEAPRSSTTPAQGQQLALEWEEHGGESSMANPPGPKTAAKSKAQPTPQTGKGKGGSTTPGGVVKQEQNIGTSAQLAKQDNLHRANTTMQQTPRTNEPDLEAMLDKEIKKEPQEQGSSPAPASTAALPNPPHQAPSQQQETQPGANPPAVVSQAVQQTPAGTGSHDGALEVLSGLPKGRKEKTPAQKAAHARYMKFSRSFDRKDCPKEMKQAYRNAAYCKERLQVLQDAWNQCEGNWRRSDLYLRLTNKTTHSQKGARVWMTHSQIAKKYESAEIADQITSSKLQDEELSRTHVKPHPDMPDNKDMRLFLVWDSESISEQTDTIIEDLFSCVDGSSDSEAPHHKRRSKSSSKKAKKEKDSESSESGSESGSEDSNKAAKKKKKKGKAGKKKGKGGKNKKETKEQKEKRLEKEQKKIDKEKERDQQKVVKTLFAKGKKAMTLLNDKIVDACGREKSIAGLSPDLKKALADPIQRKKNAMCDLRGRIQKDLESFNEANLEKLADDANKLISDYTMFLSRSNMK